MAIVIKIKCLSHLIITLLLLSINQVECFSHRRHLKQSSSPNVNQVATSDPTPEAVQLLNFIQSLNVDKLWQKKEHVAWFSGINNHPSATFKTHCSAFMAAVAERAGVPLLRPPQHGQDLLANSQHRWLEGAGTKVGWTVTTSPVVAQAAANVGMLAVISKANPDPHSPGHAAVVIPNRAPSIDFLILNGPQEAQAGSINSGNLTANKGFRPLNTPNVFYAYYSRQQEAPLLNYSVWSDGKKPVSNTYLFDLAPAGRLDAIKLSYSSGMPVWYYTDLGLDVNNTGSASWYAYYRYDGAKGEPFDVKSKGTSKFVFQQEKNAVTVDNAPVVFDSSTPVVDGLTGLWYATIDANMLGIFITSSDDSSLQGYWLAYNEDKKKDGMYQKFSATWVKKDANDTSGVKTAQGKMQSCTLVSGNNVQCTTTANDLQLSIDGGMATMNNLPGRQQLAAFQKATVFKPVLGPLPPLQ